MLEYCLEFGTGLLLQPLEVLVAARYSVEHSNMGVLQDRLQPAEDTLDQAIGEAEGYHGGKADQAQGATVVPSGGVKGPARRTHGDRRVPALDNLASVAGKEVVDEYNVAEVVKMKAMQLSAKLSIPRSQQPRVNQQGRIAKAGKGAREHPGVDAAQYCMVSQDKIISLVKL